MTTTAGGCGFENPELRLRDTSRVLLGHENRKERATLLDGRLREYIKRSIPYTDEGTAFILHRRHRDAAGIVYAARRQLNSWAMSTLSGRYVCRSIPPMEGQPCGGASFAIHRRDEGTPVWGLIGSAGGLEKGRAR